MPDKNIPANAKTASARLKVETALKSTIESELARQKVSVVGLNGGEGGGTPFSRGVIFSKASGFSRGVIFSKAAAMGDPVDESPILNQAVDMEETAFHDFANRLIALKQLKNTGGNG